MTDATTGGALDAVLDAVLETAPAIAGGLPDRREYLDEENPSAERQLAADVWADELLREALTPLDGVGQYASEESDEVVDCGDGLAVTVDPLDGSSNIPTNNIAGTICGVYDGDLPCSGEQLVGAAYVVFGPLTTAMVARDGSVTEYVLERDGDGSGDVSRRVAARDVTLPEPTVFGFGGGVDGWTGDFRALAEEIRHELKLRYGGAMVGDVNQVVHKGGIFSYPHLRDRPHGKLRLVFEAAPMAYVMVAAGGSSTDGERSLLAVEPEELHQRTPVHLGNAELIDRVEDAVEYER